MELEGKNEIEQIFNLLYLKYGHQGWWPIKKESSAENFEKNLNNYHPGNYSYPENEQQSLEVCLGAILTQNTSWKNVEMALSSLEKSNLLNLKALLEIEKDDLAPIIKSAGYFNQKARYLKSFCSFINETGWEYLLNLELIELRKLLLKQLGIGEETADSILLYAFKKPSFVIDAYTKRILFYLGIIEEKAVYSIVKEIFEKNLPCDFKLYQEYHALIVVHAKNYYSKKPYGEKDTVLSKIRKS